MTEIGVHKAKTHLSRLLKRVENGESFSITNRGRVVAVMVPPHDISQVKTNDAYDEKKLKLFTADYFVPILLLIALD